MTSLRVAVSLTALRPLAKLRVEFVSDRLEGRAEDLVSGRSRAQER